MATRIDDRWLWLGVGVFFYFAAKYVKYAVTDIVRLTELDPAQFPANDADHGAHPEESIEVKTLKTLCLSPNPSIAAAAHSLVIRRFAAQPNAIDILRRDIDSKNPETSRRAKQAVQYLYDFDLELRHSLPRGGLDDLDLPMEYADDVAYRDENGELQLMDVDDWNAMARARNRQQNSLDDERAMDVVARLEELSEEIARTEREMDDLQARANHARFAGWDRIPAPIRPTFASGGLQGSEAEDRRRRHREAMVLHEGDGRVEEEDIIRPSASRWP
ncbi:hypothetical protein CKM354_000696300 [Cercospora kikuchii]|uniref:Uncharacterized protein n=1 Tax=Cercospora kikuchii TaxID=84275 RepID=A0A9P3CLV7_9PEZI|nr:uncharacterized protein CKM354_000696300 [Cercospora kikuchii]GIZ43747.1 hypothetical protein CKM354_000696300 [Cercospora kikuchii]